MENKINNLLFILFLLLQILRSIFTQTSPLCTLKLACNSKCESAKLIDGSNNSETVISLIVKQTISDGTSQYIQYENQFSCQPGDKIHFKSTNENAGEIAGIVGNLEIFKKKMIIIFNILQL